MTWEFGVNDAETVELWSEAVIRDAEKMTTFTALMTSMQEGAVRNKNANQIDGIINVHTEFAGKDTAGRTLTLSNVEDIPATEQGVEGDSVLSGTGADLSTNTMQLKFNSIAEQVRNTGDMSDRGPVMKFRNTAREKLARWARFKIEGAIIIQLWGLTSYSNTTKLKYWPQTGVNTSVFDNTIRAFDSNHIMYAGDATSNSEIDSSDLLTAELLTKMETYALEDLSIPLEPIMVDGEPELILFTSNRGKEQLLYDDSWLAANRAGSQSSDNPIVKRSIGKFGMIRVIPIAHALNAAAATDAVGQVGQSVLCGKNALQMAKVEDFSWFEDFEDNRKRRKVISIGGTFGIAPTYIDSERRNALAIRHYLRA